MSTSKGTEPVVLEVLNICTTEDITAMTQKRFKSDKSELAKYKFGKTTYGNL